MRGAVAEILRSIRKGSEPSFPAWLFFFAAGVTMVVGFLVRGHHQEEIG